MTRKLATVLLLLLVLSPLNTVWPAPDPQRLLDGIQRKYRLLSGFSATYTRELVTRSMSMLGGEVRGDLATGTISFKPPYFLRLDQETPTRELLLADETTLWWYIPDKGQAYKYPADTYGKELRLLSDLFRGLDRVDRTFKVAVAGRDNRGRDLLELHPDPPWEEMDYIVVALDDGYNIRSVALHNMLGGVTTFVIDEPDINEPFEEGFFEFEPPEGVEVQLPE